MTQLQITLPETSSQFVHNQVAAGHYSTLNDCIVDLIEKARVQAARDKLEQLIREGMESGEGEEVTPEYWQRFDAKLKMMLAERPLE